MITRPAPIEIMPITLLDTVEQVRPLLENTVRDGATDAVIELEVTSILDVLEAIHAGGTERYYATAQRDSTVIGLMGLTQPESRMREYAATANPAELVNAFVSRREQGTGVGRQLLSYLEAVAIAKGYSEFIVNSGPRYERTGWGFWTKVFGAHIATAEDYYGPHYDALVWRKVF